MTTVYFIIQQSMYFLIPLLIVSLGAMYSERSGVTNIALEGIMIIGGFAGTCIIHVFGTRTSGYGLLFIAVLISGIVGALYSLLHAYASVKLGADQTISGTALNLFAPALCLFLSRGIFGSKQISFTDAFHIDKIPVLGDIPVIGPLFFQNCYLTTYFGILLFIVLSIVIEKTRYGLRLRSCGENPEAAASCGIDVIKMRNQGVLISGILGGMGGLIFVVPTSTEFASDVAGYGFLALSVLIMGRWQAKGILPAAIFFGILKAVASSYSGIDFLSSLPIAAEIYKLMPYLITLIVLAFSSRKSKAPKSVGIPYYNQSQNKKDRKYIKRKRINMAVLITIAVLVLGFGITLQQIKHGGENDPSLGFGAEIAHVMTSTSSVDDKGFNEGTWEGISEISETLNMTRKYYQATDESQNSMNQCIDLAIKGNAKYIVCPCYQFENSIYIYQDKYPEVKFVFIDGTPHNEDSSDYCIANNTISVLFAEQESGFLAGYAAVMDGYRKLGFMGGMKIGSVTRFGYGFITGCNYAAEELGLAADEIEIKYNYTGTFNATPEVLTQASAWYNSGTEVIFACGGAIGSSVMKAAESSGCAVIGVDKDQSNESPSVITSALKDVKTAVVMVLEELESGELEMGQQIILDSGYSAVGLPMETSKFKCFSEEQYENIYTRISNDEISIPVDTDADSPLELDLDNITVKYIGI